MIRNDWPKQIKNNFNNAALRYSNYSFIQKYFSKKIVFALDNLNIPSGEWFDLGAGTGFLSDLIESKFLNKKITRVDFSEKMLLENKLNSQNILWDLNLGFPPCEEKVSLIVSNFCLHWLNQPYLQVRNWFDQLTPGGFLIVSYPTNNCFPEWRETCRINKITYSGLTFPKVNIYKNTFSINHIHSNNFYSYEESFQNIFSIFKSIKNIGAQSTKSKNLEIKEFKKLQTYWPKNTNGEVCLTWEINIFILKK